MKVSELLNSSPLSPVCIPDGSREINGAYIGDLLSWVMGRASAGDAWITIMSNINIVAVASLADVACIILAEGVTLAEDIIKTAEAKGVNILSSKFDAYETAVTLYKLI